MKASKKILITTAGILIAFLASSIVILKGELRIVVDNYGKNGKYEPYEVSDFDTLLVDSNWEIQVSQGRDLKVEIVNEGFTEPNIYNEKGSITFHRQPPVSLSGAKTRKARITVPNLKLIMALGNAKVELSDFNQDSLNVKLEDSVVFVSLDNVIDHMPIETFGKARVKFKNSNPN